MKIQIIKRIVYAVLIILWMITIFEFSNQNGDTSQGTSDVITDKIIEINNDLENKRDQVSFCVRKLAHRRNFGFWIFRYIFFTKKVRYCICFNVWNSICELRWISSVIYFRKVSTNTWCLYRYMRSDNRRDNIMFCKKA